MGVRRLPVLAVLGPSSASADELETAAEVGRLAADCGWVVLTGGGPGVMEAACRGAVESGGLTVGMLPGAAEQEGYPNPWVVVPIFTGAGMARNAYNVLSANHCVAIGGGPGTLSEIALALKAGTEVWCYRSWELDPPPGRRREAPPKFGEREDLLEALEERLRQR